MPHISMIGCTAPSHIYPSLALIRELVARGHRVTYAVGESQADLVKSSGAEVVTHPTLLPEVDGVWPQDPGAAMRVFLDEGMALLPRLAERYEHDRPDLFLYDIGGLAAPVLAARYSVPAVQLSPTVVAWNGYEDDLAEALKALKDSESGRDYYTAFNAWLRQNGIESDAAAWQNHPEHVLSLIPRAMQPNEDRVGPNVRFVGPCLDPERLADRSWTPPGDRPVLLVSFGTSVTDQLDVYQGCLAAFADSGWHVVLVIGRHVEFAELGEIPPNFEVHRTVPQPAVLEAASAFITHAGMGSCAEALWFGVPTVAIPQATDGFGNAAQLDALGVGKHLPAGEVNAATLRTSVDSVAGDAAMAHRLAELGAKVRTEGGLTRAADAVEGFLG
ncbi:MAG: glycosyltransferase [Amycolatopsis sp.]|uniref:macrolide family glycosyltransferase n=1 Tax=Amycolatopsis sp. TaxID=37632 RepID=UPI002634CD36|nr:macrolide family glycosyltransferase [Amycolatopsis sp.]MCU1679746.1 glycosyltransferase [Amycolatopsis sp.]